MASSDKQDKPAMWQEHIRAWQHSGMTQQAYCEANGLTTASFTYWRKRLKALHDNAPLRVIPVLRSSAPAALQLHSPSGWRVEVPANTSADLLRTLIASLP